MERPESYLENNIRDLKIKSVLDCGTGHSGVFDYGFWQSKKLDFKVCLDIKLIRKDVPGWQKIIADARRLPFKNGSFDLIQCTETLEHIPPKDHLTVLRELKRVARKAVFVTSSGKSQHKPSPEEEALQKINPYAKYEGIVSKALLEKEGFRILYHWVEEPNVKEHVKAIFKR